MLFLAEESDYAHIPINAFPYEEKRLEVWSRMRRHNLCLMPSLHEGFGLAGWEAIGLEVPLILSKHSGLFQLLCNLNAESYVQVIDITGITGQDIEPLSQCISKMYFNKQKYKDKATALKKYLLDKEYTWETTARNFLEAIEISPGMSETSLNISHPYFQARPADLGQSFDTLIFERTRNFIGREFVFKSLDTFLAKKSRESGYFIIKGEPGIGKSALMAYLVKNRGYIHHFNIALQSINKPRQFLKSICAQLIVRYKLDHLKWPPDAEKDGAFLNQLLWEASEKLKHGDKLVIAIDALDEADITEQSSRANVFFLPPNLPSNVFFIITTRPKYDLQLGVLNQQVLELDAESDDNLQDAGTYVKFHLRNEQMQERIAIWNVTPEQFTEKMQKKSEGNFMYLYHVLPAIQKGDFVRGGLDELPEVLLAYYQSHWRQMRSRDESTFEQFYQPIVCVLAAVKEAVTIEQVSAFTELPLGKIRNVIREWREFLYEEISKERKRLYRVYHTTFQEFLKDEVDPGLKTYHKMIAGYYLKLAGRKIVDENSKSKTR
ncbi:MAG: hypothetical protein GY795_49580 [Desulfobacterales bacterium]|nr:hypothetical protein [Desulfobacterales bacterium]